MSELSEILFAELEKHLLPSGRPVLTALKGYVESLEKRIEELELRVQSLEGQLAKNSSNSHKPPSSDGLKKKRITNTRERNGRNPGGQPGRRGTTLELSAAPDVTVEVPHECCNRCGASLKDAKVSGIERRQIVDLPPIEPIVTEYRSPVCECSQCGQESRAQFPDNVPYGVSYGERLRAVALYLMNQHLIPYERTAEICGEVLGTSVSVGMLCELNTACYELLSAESAAIRAEITASEVVSFDETGLRCEGKLQWCHTASTETATHYEVHEKRGREAMDAIGILPNFQGIAVHDHFKSYFEYDCEHALCNAHHLRELKFVHEEDKEQWAGEMRLLLKMANETQDLSAEKRAEIERGYDDIVARGYAFHATLPDFGERKKGARGRLKQRPSKNLLIRLDRHKAQVLRFLENLNVPFTNNQGERDLRMQKLKQKISGCHRTSHGAQTFCRIRGFISTAKKRGLNTLTALADVLRGKSVFAHAADTG